MIFGHVDELILEHEEVVTLQVQVLPDFLLVFAFVQGYLAPVVDEFKCVRLFGDIVSPSESDAAAKVDLDGHPLLLKRLLEFSAADEFLDVLVLALGHGHAQCKAYGFNEC